ncbi:MAG: carbohydrate ABC transporter permease [Massiliimalia sp.]
MKSKKLISRTLLYLFLTLFALLMVLPFVWMITSSFKTMAEINMIPSTLLPKEPTFNNYTTVWDKVSFGRIFLNSVVLSIVKTAIILYTSAIVGYVISKVDFKYNKTVFLIVLCTMMIPWPVTIIPMYQEMSWFGWIGSYTSLIVPSLFSSFGIYMMKQFIDSIPNELLEAARIDGATEYGIFHRIILGNISSALSALGIFQFLWVWDDFLWPQLMLTDSSKYTLPLGLRSLTGQFFSDYGPILAGATISVIPVLIVYLIFQKQFVEGIAMSGMKG